MAQTLSEKQIKAGALALPGKSRAKLADRLLESLDEPRHEVDRAWGQVAASRLAELKSGKVKGIPGKEAHRRFREHLKRMRAKCPK